MTAYSVSKSVWTFLAEANWWFHVPQHVIHVSVHDTTSVEPNKPQLLSYTEISE